MKHLPWISKVRLTNNATPESCLYFALPNIQRFQFDISCWELFPLSNPGASTVDHMIWISDGWLERKIHRCKHLCKEYPPSGHACQESKSTRCLNMPWCQLSSRLKTIRIKLTTVPPLTIPTTISWTGVVLHAVFTFVNFANHLYIKFHRNYKQNHQYICVFLMQVLLKRKQQAKKPLFKKSC